jgi:hypothetical protein
MAETLVPNITHLVAHMSYSGSIWSNSMYVLKVAGGYLDGTEDVVGDFSEFMQQQVPNAGFLETVTGYNVYQRIKGEVNVEHPPLFQDTYHIAGGHDAAYNGSPIGSPLPKDVCVFVKLFTSGGRSGKLFIRNLLEESDVDSAVSGQWEFSAGSTRFTTTRFAATVTSSIGENLIGGADYANFRFVVCHLLLKKPGDARAAYTTPISAVSAIKPVWNTALR